MRTSWLVLAGALLVCASCASGTEKVRPAPGWAEGKEVREGHVFSLSDQHLSLFDPRRPEADGLVLKVTPGTAFVRGGRHVQRADIEEGTPVRVYFQDGPEQPMAARVEVIEAMGGAR